MIKGHCNHSLSLCLMVTAQADLEWTHSIAIEIHEDRQVAHGEPAVIESAVPTSSGTPRTYSTVTASVHSYETLHDATKMNNIDSQILIAGEPT